MHCVQLDSDELDLRCVLWVVGVLVGGLEGHLADEGGWRLVCGPGKQWRQASSCIPAQRLAHPPACLHHCSAVEQLVEASQTRAIADALLRLRRQISGGAWRCRTLAQLLDLLDADMDGPGGLDALAGGGRAQPGGNLARPRRFELAAAINRLRTAQLCQQQQQQQQH